MSQKGIGIDAWDPTFLEFYLCFFSREEIRSRQVQNVRGIGGIAASSHKFHTLFLSYGESEESTRNRAGIGGIAESTSDAAAGAEGTDRQEAESTSDAEAGAEGTDRQEVSTGSLGLFPGRFEGASHW